MLLSKYESILSKYKISLSKYQSILAKPKNTFSMHKNMLSMYKSMRSKYRSNLSKCLSIFSKNKSLLSKYKSILSKCISAPSDRNLRNLELSNTSGSQSPVPRTGSVQTIRRNPSNMETFKTSRMQPSESGTLAMPRVRNPFFRNRKPVGIHRNPEPRFQGLIRRNRKICHLEPIPGTNSRNGSQNPSYCQLSYQDHPKIKNFFQKKLICPLSNPCCVHPGDSGSQVPFKLAWPQRRTKQQRQAITWSNNTPTNRLELN